MNDELAWKALGDPTRRTLLDLLRQRERTTGELCSYFPQLSRFAVMKHLKLLQDANLVIVRSKGRQRWNYLNVIPMQEIYQRWMKPYEAQWASTLMDLKILVEQGDTLTTPRMIEIEQDINIKGNSETIFNALTENTGYWWGKPYINSSAENIVIENRLGGVFKEIWSESDGSILGFVTEYKKNSILEITGNIHMRGATNGKIRFELEPCSQGTSLKFSHSAVGNITEKMETNWEKGWKDLLGKRLKIFVEKNECLGIRSMK